MAVLTVAKAREMVRLRVLERDPAFWDEDQCDRAFDDGARRLLDLVIGGAHIARRTRRHGHPFLRRFIAVSTGTAGVNQYEISLPTDLWYEVEFRIAGSPPVPAKWKEPEEDRYIRTWHREFGPGPGEAFWTIVPDSAATAVLRFYYGDDEWLSNQSLSYEFVYLRKYSPCWNQSPAVTSTDIDEEYCEGIIAYAAGKLLSDQRSDPTPLYNELVEYAKRIGLPPINPAEPVVLPKRVP